MERQIGERVYSTADHPSDDGPEVIRGESGHVVGYRGNELLVKWESGLWSTLPSQALAVARGGQARARS